MPGFIRGIITFLFKPVTYPNDEEKSRSSVLLHYIILFVNTPVILSYTVMSRPEALVIQIALASTFIYNLFALYLNRTGRVKAAALLILAFGWGINATASWYNGGINSPSFGYNITTLILAYLLLGIRWGVVFTVLAVFNTTAIIVVTRLELLVVGQDTFLNVSIHHMNIILVTSVLTAYIVSSMLQALKKYRLLAGNTDDVIWLYNIEKNNLEFISPSISRMSGYSVKEFLAIPLDKHFKKKDLIDTKEKVREWLSNAAAGAGSNSYIVELEQQRKDDTYLPVEIVITLLGSSDGDSSRLLGVTRDISERKKTETILRDNLHERETLLRELYHRTKNNMQVILSIIELKSIFRGKEDCGDILREIGTRIRSMSLVHQKLYQSENLSRIALGEYFSDLIDLLKQTYHNDRVSASVNIIREAPPVLIDTALPAGMIISELYSNSMKHALDKNGAVKIALDMEYQDDGQICLRYSDNGPGLPPDFDLSTAAGMGIKTIFALGKDQLDGKVSHRNLNGLEFLIEFKEDGYIQRV